MKGLVPLLEAVAKLRTEREVELTVIGRPARGWPGRPCHRAPRAVRRRALRQRHQRRRAGRASTGEAEVAVVPSLYEGFSLPAIEAMACGVAVVATTGGALPEVVGADGETGLLVRTRRPGRAGRRHRPPPRRPGAAGPARGGRPRAGDQSLHLAGDGGGHGGLLRGPPGGAAAARCAPRGTRSGRTATAPKRRGRMLTVDYDKLGVGPGDRCWTSAAGSVATHSRRPAAGRPVVALDAGPEEVAQVRGTLGAMIEAGELAADHPATAVQGDALALPFADATFDRVIASEVLEHIPDDSGRHARVGPGASPRWHHGGHGAALRPRGRQLGPLGRVPRHARGPRAHLPALDPGAPARLRRAASRPGSTTPTGSTRRIGGCAASSARATTPTRPSRRTTRCWCGTSSRLPS